MPTVSSQRKLLELIDLDYVFSQNHLLDSEELREACKRRGLSLPYGDLAERQLEALHRVGILVPIYRIVKNMRKLHQRAQEENVPLWFVMGRASVRGLDLRIERDARRIHDPRVEGFKPWRRYERRLDNGRVHTSEFLYSPYQLLLIERIRSLVAMMRPRRVTQGGHRYDLKLSQDIQEHVYKECIHNDELILTLSALDRIYRPQIIGVLRLPGPGIRDQEEREVFEKSFDPAAMLNWLGWGAERVRDEAERLLRAAGYLDPLDDWLPLIRLCRPEKWERLRGDALIAMDHRIAAEILLRFYDDLVDAGVAPALPQIPRYAPHPLQDRLKVDRSKLDAVLMDYGLSPQPSLILFLEGETEMYIIPKLLERFEMHWPRNFIEIQNARGNRQNIGKLASYIAPLTLGEVHNDFVLLTRPPTRFLVVFDGESMFADAQKREEARRQWVDTLFETISEEHRTEVLRQDLDTLVEIETWEAGAFEYEHFSDREITQAIYAACRRLGIQPKEIPDWQIQDARTRKRNIEKLFKHWSKKLSKTELAIDLWPILELKIQRAIETNTLDTIPIVRVLRLALERALSVHRYGVAIHRGPVPG